MTTVEERSTDLFQQITRAAARNILLGERTEYDIAPLLTTQSQFTEIHELMDAEPEMLRQLIWLRTTRPDEFFNDGTHLHPELQALLDAADQRRNRWHEIADEHEIPRRMDKQ